MENMLSYQVESFKLEMFLLKMDLRLTNAERNTDLLVKPSCLQLQEDWS